MHSQTTFICRSQKHSPPVCEARSTQIENTFNFILENERQQAIDYLMGSLSEAERISYETLLASNTSTQKLVAEISDDWSSLALLAKPAEPDSDLRSRTLMLTQEPADLSSFLESDCINQLRENYTQPSQRYLGGDGAVDSNEIKNVSQKDGLFRTYEHLLGILPLVSGQSPAAFGDFGALQKFASANFSIENELDELTDPLIPDQNPVAHSLQRTLLASLPSLSHFLDLAGAGNIGLSDIRRIFYLCRDQLKIMRASFRDLDPQRLAQDELIRIHGTHLLRQKWTGARHAFFNSSGLASCGNFFEGPISERCVEFAEYDSNLYCLANLIASRSATGGFQLELIKDAVPGCVLAVTHAEVSQGMHDELSALSSDNSTTLPNGLSKDACLWSLLKGSMSRGFPHHSLGELSEASFFGKQRVDGETYLWFAWPEIENAHSGAVASTAKPGQ
jgi:hypothetical protein